MPRKPRLDTRNGLHHVIAKGNNSCAIFREQADFSKFMHLLSDARTKDPHLLLAFCLMPNHIHLLTETKDVPLSRIMHRLLLRYTIFFNRKYNRSGHLFENRFKSKPCKDENYLLQLLVYIHDNPRRAGLVTSKDTYLHSSERAYQRRLATKSPVDNLRALQLIGPSPKTAWKSYHHYLSYTREESDLTSGCDENISEADTLFFPYEEVYKEAIPVAALPGTGTEFDFLKNVPLGQICEWVSEIMEVEKEAILGNGKDEGASRARSAFLYIAKEAGWRSVDLKNEFGFYAGTIAYHEDRFGKVFTDKKREQIKRKLRALSGR